MMLMKMHSSRLDFVGINYKAFRWPKMLKEAVPMGVPIVASALCTLHTVGGIHVATILCMLQETMVYIW